MSEESMIAATQDALQARGVSDQLEAVGQFNPRGHTGGLFIGGMAGSSAGDAIGGNLVGSIGLGLGSIAGQHASDKASGLPSNMLVGVSATHIYGFASKGRREAHDLVFALDRAKTEVKVHQRVNVRILELIDKESDSRVELEGNRIPLTHTKDVLDVLEADRDRS